MNSVSNIAQQEQGRDAAPARLHIALMGSFRLRDCDGNPIASANQRGRMLLSLLAANLGQPFERSVLAEQLWPGRYPAQARASLRQCLLSLRRDLTVVDFDPIIATNATLALSANGVSTDLMDLEQLLGAGDAERALRWFNEHRGLRLLGAFEGDMASLRIVQQVREQLLTRLERSVEACATAQPSHTDNGLQLRSAWKRFQQPAGWETQTAIAILPFEQDPQGDDDVAFAVGVEEELADRLSSVSGIALTSQRSVRSVLTKQATLTEIAAQLQVSHIIEGNVRREAGQASIHAALIDGRTGLQIWSKREVVPIDELIDLRAAIGDRFVAGIGEALGVAVQTSPARTMTRDREAYALYLQGRALTLQALGEDVIERGVGLLEQALDRDPDFAEAWAALAEAHLYSAIFTRTLRRVELGEKMGQCVQSALELKPDSAHALAMRGVYEFVAKRPVKALELGYRAHDLDPSNVDVMVRLGSFLLYLGRTREAMPYIVKAIEREPTQGRTFVALCAAHMGVGDFDKAIAAGQRMADLGIPEFWLAVAQAAAGQHETATTTYFALRRYLGTLIQPPPGMQELSEEAANGYFTVASRGVCSGTAQDRAVYCQMLDGLHQTMADPYDPSIAYPAIWMGHAELVMKIYGERIDVGNIFGLMTLWAPTDPIARTRDHPDFMAWCDDMGFVEAWDQYGWPDLIPSDPRKS